MNIRKFLMPPPIRKIATALARWRQLRAMPLRLEFILTDYCNLNCKGCTHYSPLAAKEFTPLETVEASMQKLSEVCGGKVEKCYLIGGETLLYPRLNEAMQALRRHFPTQTLYVFTNGIALPKMDDSFWQTARQQNFILAITRYPIHFDYDAAIALCHKYGVKTEIFGDRTLADSFFRFALDPTKKQNARISHFKCYNRGCLSVIGNRLYPCSISGCVSHLNKAKGTAFEHCDGDRLDIDKITGISQIRRLRDRPVPFCAYCINPPATVKYGPSARETSEWVETETNVQA